VSYLRVIDDKGVKRFEYGVKAQDADAVGNACLEAAGASNMEELKAIYQKYEAKYKGNTYFISAVNKRKNELNAA
jgi:hypothetical protein